MPFSLNKLCRPLDQAQAALGSIVSDDGVDYRCADHNDLGVLYWQPLGRNGKPKGKMVYGRYLDALAGFPGAY